MKQSDQSPPSSASRNSPGVPSPVDTYFQQLTSIDLEYFKELVPVYSDFDQTIVRAIITDVGKLQRSGFQCIKRIKKAPRTSLPPQSDWLKLIEEKENYNRPRNHVEVNVMEHHHHEGAELETREKNTHQFT
ncbi:hypothetical protein Pst134EA_019407 [Puccinia striiformis f. sp. tritici]|uniref:hypothetical protein n=1 Tax=Puccinia striiformis f. sp. tritici TaxID=168172 RepID=UPI002007251A|nr:hypothetical protein Pst134EA_019407 [Puccinia striiformis f. sp. tritici]KAH9459252.1 hypothetical protein Pst134EA_019407 [Puccinia striiformis f. sp. tritici]KAI9615701.1 hypothetical protein H4Q26_011338 [Puccinia striiformis f. sp. tritici PST-130]